MSTPYVTPPTLRLLPTDFPRCECGHLRVHHEDDLLQHATGRCSRERDCGCSRFVAQTGD